ncbi:unnamed protein product, partial [Rotaria magnacalcarata]
MMDKNAATEEVILTLVEALEDYNERVRATAGDALLDIYEKENLAEIIQTLLGGLQHGSVRVKRGSCKAIGLLGERAAEDDVIKVLLDVIGDKDWFVRKAARVTLNHMGEEGKTKAVIEHIVCKLGHEMSNTESNCLDRAVTLA